MMYSEFNFDGLVGPTHHYGGLGSGNLASRKHGGQLSNPRAAALQGISKMRLLHERGIRQAVLPPHSRPDLHLLRRLGFSGSDSQIIESAFRHAPEILSSCFSASAMWTANAATVAPSCDTSDGRLHLVPANLNAQIHRSLEADETYRNLAAIFADTHFFKVHPPLPQFSQFGDEGAANHTRFCDANGKKGTHLFVYGRTLQGRTPEPRKFHARQTREASEAVARLLKLDSSSCIFARQNPLVIDQGVFHNDVISVGHENLFLYHEEAFSDQEGVLSALRSSIETAGREACFIPVSADELSVREAVRTYLFNSQIVDLSGGSMLLVAPEECSRSAATMGVIQRILEENNPLREVVFLDLKQSMQNGGGPACLRNRIRMTEPEAAALRGRLIVDEALLTDLEAWVRRFYRDSLAFEDLRDPALPDEIQSALNALAGILELNV